MMAFSLAACGGKNNSGLDPSIASRIKQDWQSQFGTELSTINYYGTHDGYVAFFVAGDNTVVVDAKIAGTIFRYSNNWTIYLWKDSMFHDMIDAYQQGLLTAESIEQIGCYHVEYMKKQWSGDDESFRAWYFNSDDITSIIE
jgi:hypothetical protein